MGDQFANSSLINKLLVIVAVGLAIFSFWLLIVNYRTLLEINHMNEQSAVKTSRNFQYYFKENKNLSAQVKNMTEELDQARQELVSISGELSFIQGVNNDLKDGIAALERYKSAAVAKGEALESMINAFRRKNKEIESELKSVRQELAKLQPDISDLDEGRSKVLLFKDRIRGVRRNMSSLRRKAADVRAGAQKERDRLESLYGNGGYMVKNGENVSMNISGQRNVAIDVKFVN
jgi:chromosome segregation ATPase